MMNFNTLQSTLQTLDQQFKIEAGKSVNRLLTIKNWLFGFYIVEFQQNGEDRAAYGTQLLDKLAENLDVKGLSARNLKLYRQFYLTYVHLKPAVYTFLKKIPTNKSLLLQKNTTDYQYHRIMQSAIAQFEQPSGKIAFSSLSPSPEKLLSHLSYTHFSLLLTCDSPLQRAFYEIECIRGAWSVRELKRQIKTLLYERTGLSNDKEELIGRIHEQVEPLQVADFIRSPYVFEFLELPNKLLFEESEFEQALINHLQEFLIELGNGFCFEARQKRVLFGDDWHFIDLVFYHRILKCHILIDLKIEGFKPAFVGNMNAYLNYYKEEIKRPEDYPPIGLILCTNKEEAAVRYALGGLDEQLFVSQYKVLLPDEAVLKAFIERERGLLE